MGSVQVLQRTQRTGKASSEDDDDSNYRGFRTGMLLR